MSPSSTSSSKPRKRCRAPGLLGALALLLVFELGVGRQDWFWRLAGVKVVEELERLVVEPCAEPRLLVLGSSRLQLGAAPRVLEQALGLPHGSCLNLAMGGGTPFDALLIYRRNRARLSRAPAAVIGVEDWYYNASYPPNPRDARFATLSERWHDYQPPARQELLFNWLWQTSAIQAAAQIWLEQVNAGVPPRIQPDGRYVVDNPAAGVDPNNAELILSRFYINYRFQMGRHHQLQRLIDLCREDGLRVMVTQVPLRDAYVELAERQQAEAWAAYRRAAASFTGARLVLHERASQVGMTDADLYDYGHATDEGAGRFSRILAADLRAAFPTALAKGARTR